MNEEVYPIMQSGDNRKMISFQLCGITYPDQSYEITRRSSATTCIEFVESGGGTVHLDDKTFYPSGGDTYFLPAGHDQHYYSDKSDPWKKYFVNISGELAEHLIAGYELEGHYHLPGVSIKSELCRIMELAKKNDADRTGEYIGILNEIFYKMRSFSNLGNKKRGLADEMKEFLASKATRPFHIEELCRFTARSESQTNRIFKSAFGITPYAYVLNKRISLAKKLLKDTSLPLKEIARRLCFADEYYFSNIFKQKTGMSPIEFKKSEKR